MIPFEVDPSLYFPMIAASIVVIIFLILYAYTKMNGCLMAVVIFLLIAIAGSLMFTNGSVYTDTITICLHTEGIYYMKVVDTNQNIYYINDDLTQMKVKDNITVKVKIVDKLGHKYITFIDAPITSGNSYCEGVPT
jgi:hypothetical protein